MEQLKHELMLTPQLRYFVLDRPEIRPKKLEAIRKAIYRRTHNIPATPLLSPTSEPASFPTNSSSTGATKSSSDLIDVDGDDTAKEPASQQIESSMSIEQLQSKIEELKKEKREYFNLFKKLINDGEKKSTHASPVVANSVASSVTKSPQISTAVTASVTVDTNVDSGTDFDAATPGTDVFLSVTSPLKIPRHHSPLASAASHPSTPRVSPLNVTLGTATTSIAVAVEADSRKTPLSFEQKTSAGGRETRFGLASSYYPSTSVYSRSAAAASKYHPYGRPDDVPGSALPSSAPRSVGGYTASSEYSRYPAPSAYSQAPPPSSERDYRHPGPVAAAPMDRDRYPVGPSSLLGTDRDRYTGTPSERERYSVDSTVSERSRYPPSGVSGSDRYPLVSGPPPERDRYAGPLPVDRDRYAATPVADYKSVERYPAIGERFDYSKDSRVLERDRTLSVPATYDTEKYSPSMSPGPRDHSRYRSGADRYSFLAGQERDASTRHGPRHGVVSDAVPPEDKEWSAPDKAHEPLRHPSHPGPSGYYRPGRPYTPREYVREGNVRPDSRGPDPRAGEPRGGNYNRERSYSRQRPPPHHYQPPPSSQQPPPNYD